MEYQYPHMTEAHRMALEYIFDKATHKAKEACEHGNACATGTYIDIAKDADHILRKHHDMVKK
jgi:hypothetical protein